MTALHKNNVSGHRSHDRIVGGFTSTYAISAYLFTVRSVSLFPEHGEVYSILHSIILCDIVCLASCMCFSCTLVTSTNRPFTHFDLMFLLGLFPFKSG